MPKLEDEELRKIIEDAALAEKDGLKGEEAKNK